MVYITPNKSNIIDGLVMGFHIRIFERIFNFVPEKETCKKIELKIEKSKKGKIWVTRSKNVYYDGF